MSTPEKKPTRKGRAVRPAPGAPAKFEPGATPPPAPVPPGPFDAAAVAERLQIYYVSKRDGGWLITPTDGECVEANKATMRLLLKSEGVSTRPGPDDQSDCDRVLTYAMKKRLVDAVADCLAGWRAGFHTANSARIYVRRAPALLKPEPGDWHAIRLLLEGVFGEQMMRFCCWLKVAAESLRDETRRAGQVLIIIGPPGSCKSRIQHWIITGLLGGSVGIPTDYITGRTDFNEELFASVHQLMEDPDLCEDTESRMHFGKRINEFSVNDLRRFHPKGAKAISLPPLWRVSISMNDEQIPALPFVGDSLRGKLIILRALPFNAPIGDGSDALRAAWEGQIHSELSAFLDYLLNLEIPAELRDPRFGVKDFIAPEIESQMHEATPDARLVECFDLELWREEKEPWEGNPTELARVLQGESSECKRESRTLFKGAAQLGRMLQRLAVSRTERVRYTRSGNKRTYSIFPAGYIHPPESAAE